MIHKYFMRFFGAVNVISHVSIMQIEVRLVIVLDPPAAEINLKRI